MEIHKNKTMKTDIRHIPTGTDKESTYMRRAIIVEQLWKLIGRSVCCKAFHPRKVEFVPMSVDETATHASKNYESTLAALHVVEALEAAVMVKRTPAASQKQKKMNMKTIYELSARLPHIGEVKIIVGERASKRILHYCITKKRP